MVSSRTHHHFLHGVRGVGAHAKADGAPVWVCHNVKGQCTPLQDLGDACVVGKAAQEVARTQQDAFRVAGSHGGGLVAEQAVPIDKGDLGGRLALAHLVEHNGDGSTAWLDQCGFDKVAA